MSDSAPRPSTDEEWEDLLRQWRTRPNAQPQPFFYSRVRARLVGEAAGARPPLRTWLRWPSYAALLGIVLLLSGDGAALRSAEPVSPYQLDSGGSPPERPAAN
jgi:hypothetical protein